MNQIDHGAVTNTDTSGHVFINERLVSAAASMSTFEPTPAANPRIRERPLCAISRHSNQANKTELPSKRVPIAKI
ncbi:MAG: hypothetical protein ACU0B1_15200, partial [Thermohalobaculum sp.]